MYRRDPNSSEANEIIVESKATLTKLMEGDLNGLFCENLEKSIKRMLANPDNSKCAHTARAILSTGMHEEIAQLQSRLSSARKTSEESLEQMEKWGVREKETAEYSKILQEEEEQWIRDNSEANMSALKIMRSFIPLKVSEMTIADIMDATKQHGGLLTVELATEIKTNKLLHWIVMHPTDIAMSSFLTGEHRQYFVNIDALDLVEMRAIRCCLPDKFELDNDGQKAEWRSRFISRLKQMVLQANQEQVKGGWDFESGKRAMVTLPPLAPDSLRRPIYFFRTYAQTVARLKQYTDRQALLERKEKELARLTAECIERKKEYDTVLVEMRDAEFKAVYGLETLTSAKEIAKSEWQQSESQKKDVASHISRIRKAVADCPLTLNEFTATMSEVKSYLSSQSIIWEEVTAPIAISGERVCNLVYL